MKGEHPYRPALLLHISSRNTFWERWWRKFRFNNSLTSNLEKRVLIRNRIRPLVR
jgi:hypothetical protein